MFVFPVANVSICKTVKQQVDFYLNVSVNFIILKGKKGQINELFTFVAQRQTQTLCMSS